MNKSLITAIVLTYNEEIHIERCINNLKKIHANIIIVDSYSSDATLKIANKLGVEIYQNKWINYSTQYNWALKNCNINTEWILRIDADEILEDELTNEINTKLPLLSDNINGVCVLRGFYLLGKEMNYGMTKIYHLKLWRTGTGYCEPTWMDEHIKLYRGSAIKFKNGKLLDINLNSLQDLVQKHNGYATREAIHYYSLKYSFKTNAYKVIARLDGEQEEKIKYFKGIYYKSPMFLRAFFYFCYRYFVLFGFLDGTRGFIYHFLQGFWYRIMVDFRIYEINLYARKDKARIVEYFKKYHGYDIEQY